MAIERVHEPCPTCGRTYGITVEIPDRCGVCITGMSIDGRPIYPKQQSDGSWRCPCCGNEAARLPDGTFTHSVDRLVN